MLKREQSSVLTQSGEPRPILRGTAGGDPRKVATLWGWGHRGAGEKLGEKGCPGSTPRWHWVPCARGWDACPLPSQQEEARVGVGDAPASHHLPLAGHFVALRARARAGSSSAVTKH